MFPDHKFWLPQLNNTDLSTFLESTLNRIYLSALFHSSQLSRKIGQLKKPHIWLGTSYHLNLVRSWELNPNTQFQKNPHFFNSNFHRHLKKLWILHWLQKRISLWQTCLCFKLPFTCISEFFADQTHIVYSLMPRLCFKEFSY